MRLLVYRTAVFLWYAVRWYRLWSGAYRFLRERWARSVRLPEYEDLDALSRDVGAIGWRRDKGAELWDAVSSPKATWARHLAGKPGGDCDDISIYAVDRMVDMVRRCELTTIGVIKREHVGMLTVSWYDEKERASSGHNVCCFSYRGPNGNLRWAHLSNWHSGAVQWGFATIEDAARSLLGPDKKCVGWGWWRDDLKLMRRGWKV